MGLIERLRQEKDALEQGRLVQQAAKAEEEALHKQRKDKAAAFRAESGIGDLVATAADLLKKVRFSDASYSNGRVIQDQRFTEVDSVLDGITWGKLSKHSSRMVRPREGHYYVSIATRPTGEIVFYAKKEISVTEADWRKNQDILESTLEQALNLPGEAYEPEPPPLEGPTYNVPRYGPPW